MTKLVFMTAICTGVFCAGFAVFVNFVTDALGMLSLIAVSFLSGFFGSTIGQLIVRPWQQSSRS